jgi:hypothetical protein
MFPYVFTTVSALVWLSLAPLTWAATYYADAARPNNSASCDQAQSRGTAKKTINAAIGCMSGGDTVVVLDGQYHEMLSTYQGAQAGVNAIPNGLSAQRPTIIRAEHKHGAILTMTPSGDYYASIELGPGAAHITFENFVLDGNNWRVAMGFSSNEGIEHIHATDILIRRMDHMGVKMAGDNHVFTRVDMEYIAWRPDGQLTPGTQTQSTCGQGGNNFCYNEPADFAHHLCEGYCHAYYIYGANWLVTEGTIKHIDGYAYQHSGSNPAPNHTYRNMALEDIRGVAALNHHATLYNLTAKKMLTGITTNGAHTIVHNTFTQTNTRHGNVGLLVNQQTGPPSLIKNNLFFDFAGEYIFINDGSGNNLLASGPHPNVQGNVCDVRQSGCLYVAPGTPLVTNVGAGDFRLVATSPAVNAAVNDSSVAAYTPDKGGVPRPQGGGRDAGAYEFTTGGTSTVLPPPTLSLAPRSGP